MAYDTIVLRNAVLAKAINVSANTSLYKLILPSNAKPFTLDRVITTVASAIGAVATQIKVYKTGLAINGGTGAAVLLKTCTAFQASDPVGTSVEDEVVNAVVATVMCTNTFYPGDTLDIQSVAATNTGTLNIDLVLGMNT